MYFWQHVFVFSSYPNVLVSTRYKMVSLYPKEVEILKRNLEVFQWRPVVVFLEKKWLLLDKVVSQKVT